MTTIEHESLRVLPQRCRVCGAEQEGAAVAVCENCLGPLDPIYPAERSFPDRATIAGRAPSMWRYRESLPHRHRAARPPPVLHDLPDGARAARPDGHAAAVLHGARGEDVPDPVHHV